MTELLSNQADIICLQEVESEHLKSLFQPRLARYGYECLYKKKTGYKIDGCAIFYKSKSFNLLNHKGVEFNRTDLTHLLSRDNVGIIAVLQPRSETRSKPSHLVIANTHLLFNPARSDIRLAQLKFFLSQLEEVSLDYHDTDRDISYYHPTILCGDFNSTPDSSVSKYILGEDKNKEIKLKFKSAYPKKNSNQQSYASTFSNDIVDYIFYTHAQIKLDSYRELLTSDELEDIRPLPNSDYPSDHISLEAKFILK